MTPQTGQGDRACTCPLGDQPGIHARYCAVNGITVTLPRADLWRVYELVVTRAVTLEANEDAALTGLNSNRYRRPAEALRAALDEDRP